MKLVLMADGSVGANFACSMYEDGFNKHNILFVPASKDTAVSSRHLFQIRVENRNKIMEHLNSQKTYPGVHYRDNTLYNFYSNQRGTTPLAHRTSEEVISLPLHMNLSDDDVKFVIQKWIKAQKMYNS